MSPVLKIVEQLAIAQAKELEVSIEKEVSRQLEIRLNELGFINVRPIEANEVLASGESLGEPCLGQGNFGLDALLPAFDLTPVDIEVSAATIHYKTPSTDNITLVKTAFKLNQQGELEVIDPSLLNSGDLVVISSKLIENINNVTISEVTIINFSSTVSDEGKIVGTTRYKTVAVNDVIVEMKWI